MAITLISTQTVTGATAATIVFNSLPGTYTDLFIEASTRCATNNYFGFTFNGSSTSYSDRGLRGSGSAASSYTDTTQGFFGPPTSRNADTANTFGNTTIYIPNYAGATNKSVSIDAVHETNATGAFADIIAGLWSNTAAITSITFTGSGDFQIGSTISIYGIQKGSSGSVTVS